MTDTEVAETKSTKRASFIHMDSAPFFTPCLLAQSAGETFYTFAAPADPFLAECGQATGYTLFQASGTTHVPVRPKLPLVLEDLIIRWRGGTGEISETPGYTRVYLSLVEQAEFGTRYDFTASVAQPNEPVERRSHAWAPWILESRTNPAEELRELTGLPVDEIGEIFGVSRVTFYNWIAERPIALENERRLYAVLKLLRQVSDIRGYGPPELKRWLLTPAGTDGTTPLGLLASGDDNTLRALALRAGRPSAWTPMLSESAVINSGVSRSTMHRVGSRGWRPEFKVPSLDERLEALRPSALPEPEDVDDQDLDFIDEGRGLYSP